MSMTGYEQAQVGLGSASLINEAFGNPLRSGSVNWRGKYYRNQMQDRMEWEPGLTGANTRAAARNNILGKVSGAKRAGLHPLFALGASGGGAGSPSFSIPGQSERGDFKADGLIAALGGMANRRNDMAMQQLMSSALKVAENATSNDTAQTQTEGIEQEAKSKGQVTIIPSEVVSRSTKDSSRSAGSKPAWMQVEVWPGVFMDVPWSDEGFAESIEGLPALAAVLARNSALGYQGAYRALKKKHYEYFHTRKKKDVRRRGAQASAKRRKVVHPGSQRRRGYSGAQPYRPLGGRY